MPKRKRLGKENLGEALVAFEKELHGVLKSAKGHERQRQAKRLKDAKSTPEKIERLKKEVIVLKSIDLHQTAHAHLRSALLKFKSIAESSALPAEIKAGVPKVDVSEEEKTALHNVTSALCNRAEVRDVISRAVSATCEALGIAIPAKKDSGKKKRDISLAAADVGRQEKADQLADTERRENSKLQKRETPVQHAQPAVELDESSDEEERAISRFEARLRGNSVEDETGSNGGEELDPMVVTSGEEDVESDIEFSHADLSSGEEDESDHEEADVVESNSEDSSTDERTEDSKPHPAKRKATAKPPAQAPTRATESTFLPSLMSGYISGSESASDVDVAPPRQNRRGQRARQAIWEKKYKEKAKHLAKNAAARDKGWDARKGAVDGDQGKPWKRGVRNPLERKAAAPFVPDGANSEPLRERKKARTKDNEGELHPSWEAKKKAKEAMATATFQGKKVVFD